MSPSFRPFSPSPVLTMSPQSAHRRPLDRQNLGHHISSRGQRTAWPQMPATTRGRKRSRDEAAPNLDPLAKISEVSNGQVANHTHDFESQSAPIQPNGVHVANGATLPVNFSNQSMVNGVAREHDEFVGMTDAQVQDRPLRSHKSQRLGAPSVASSHALHRSPSREANGPMSRSSDSLAQPTVDDLTVCLGIGWSRIGEEAHIQAAARGWARFIENHFSLTNVRIRVQSRGLESYLVEADQGFFLFADNLHHGRLVSKTSSGALQNLQVSPPVFDSTETMEASTTTKPTQPVFQRQNSNSTHVNSMANITSSISISIPASSTIDIDMN